MFFGGVFNVRYNYSSIKDIKLITEFIHIIEKVGPTAIIWL